MRTATMAARELRLAGPALRRGFATTVRREATWGFIGLGRMGFPMAKNLRSKIDKSDDMIIHDVNKTVTQQFVDEVGNASIAQSVREVAEKAETIITVLPEPHHVQNVFKHMLHPATLLKDTPNTQPRLFIDCSTIDPRSSRHVANAVHSSSQGKFIDAPMSGGVVGAEAGKLTFMIGAPDDLVSKATEVLSMMGKRVVHLGPQSSGLKGKLANNYLLALNNVATCEAMHMGIKWGLDPTTLADMINTATGKCWPSEVNNPVPGVVKESPASKGYEGGFGTTLMLKDLKLALQACTEAGYLPEMGPYAKEIYTAVAGNEEYKSKDFSVVYKYISSTG